MRLRLLLFLVLASFACGGREADPAPPSKESFVAAQGEFVGSATGPWNGCTVGLAVDAAGDRWSVRLVTARGGGFDGNVRSVAGPSFILVGAPRTGHFDLASRDLVTASMSVLLTDGMWLQAEKAENGSTPTGTATLVLNDVRTVDGEVRATGEIQVTLAAEAPSQAAARFTARF
jgi:hypothetical protein